MTKRKELTKQDLIKMYVECKKRYCSNNKEMTNCEKWHCWDKMQNCILVLSMQERITRFESEQLLEKEFYKSMAKLNIQDIEKVNDTIRKLSQKKINLTIENIINDLHFENEETKQAIKYYLLACGY